MAKAGNLQITPTLPLLIILFSLSLPVYAKYSGGAGEPNDPYRIATAEDLILLGESPEDYDKHFILTADIDLDPNLPGRKVFDKAVIAPNTSGLDFQGTPFTGVFNGNGHTISHLTIEGDSYLGLFGLSVSGAKISNLGLDAEDVNGYMYVGGLVGKNGERYRAGGILANCYSTGSVSGDWLVGGLIGENAGGCIENCYSKTTIRGDRFVGGLAGGNSGQIENSYSASKFEGYFTDVGGLVGDLSVTGPTFSNVTGSFWDKKVSGLSELPPSATNRGGTGLTTDEMKDINTFLDAEWDLYGNVKDGIEDHWFIQEGNYPVLSWQTKTTGLVMIPEVVGMAEDEARACLERAGFSRSDADQADYDGRNDFDKGDVLSTIPSSYAPIGADVAVLLNLGPYDWSLNSGNGTPANPYRIASAGQLESLFFHRELYDADFVLTKDIDMIRKSYTGPLIAPHGAEPFSGKFDGRGHCIKNLTIKANISSEYKYCLGLFGAVSEDAEIRALELQDASVYCLSDNVSIGILAGFCKGMIVDCHAGGRVDGSSNVGGLIGETTGGYIIGCSANSVVYAGERAGGLVGRNGGNIYYSYFAGLVFGLDDIGGLVGVNDGLVNNCYSSGQITASKFGEYVGGLIGRNWMEHQGMGRGSITYNVHGDIENCYTTVSVLRTIKPGGLVGAGANEDIVSSYYLAVQDDDISDNGLGTLLTQVQIQDSNSFVGWDFYGTDEDGYKQIWYAREDAGPVLTWDTEATGLVPVPDITGYTMEEARERLERPGLVLGDVVGNDYHLTAGESCMICPSGYTPGAYVPVETAIEVISSLGEYDWGANPGNGTEDNPFQISTAGQLEALAGDPNMWELCFVLGSDIDLIGRQYTQALIAPAMWNSGDRISDRFDGPSFDGKFDGAGYLILNLKIAHPRLPNYLGLFGLIGKTAHIRNMCLDEVTIESPESSYLGMLTGSNDGIITNCSVTGRINGGTVIGGLVGLNYPNGSVSHCESNCRINGARGPVGGLIGGNLGGDISHSMALAMVTVSTGSASDPKNTGGGLIGISEKGRIEACSATGAVIAIGGGMPLGGLVGSLCSGDIMDCKASSTVDGGEDSMVGGLVGENNGNITTCCATGSVTGFGVSGQIGGLAGYNDGMIVDCYATGNVTGTQNVGGLVGANGKKGGHRGEPEFICGDITNCYAIGTVTASENYGPLVGTLPCGDPNTISNSYYLGGDGDWIGTDYYGIALSNEQFKDPANFQGWDFVDERANGTEDIWWILEGSDYPRLWWEDSN